MKFGRLQEKISKAPLAASADLSNEFKSIVFGTDQRKVSSFMWLIWEEQQKYLQSSQISARYHLKHSDTYVTYQTVNLVSSDKFLIDFISNVPHTFDEISTRLSISKGKYT